MPFKSEIRNVIEGPILEGKLNFYEKGLTHLGD